MPSTSVVVPAYEEADRLARTLDALGAQTAECEVVVVAGGDDGTLAVAEEHEAVDRALEDRAGTGPAAARNRGARAAAGEVLCFTDADTLPPPTWVARHRRHYRHSGVVGVGGPLRPVESSLRDRLLFRVLSDWWYRVSWPLGFVQASGNNCSYRRAAFEAAGGFDEAIPFMEDTELSLRMKRYGRVVYDADCPVRTSARRQRDRGYLGLFLTYLRGYVEYFLLGRDPDEGYFGR